MLNDFIAALAFGLMVMAIPAGYGLYIAGKAAAQEITSWRNRK